MEMFDEKDLVWRTADRYLYPPTLSSVEPTWTLPPAWSVEPEAPCRDWLPDLLRRGWQVGPAQEPAPYFTARRLLGSPAALIVIGVVSALVGALSASQGMGEGGAVLAFAITAVVLLGGRMLWTLANGPSQLERAAPPHMLQAHARGAKAYTPPQSAPEGRMLTAAVRAIHQIAASPAWRSPELQAWTLQLQLNLVDEWSEIRFRVGRICEIRYKIEQAPDMPKPMLDALHAQIHALLNATNIRAQALVDYSARLRQVEACLRALHDAQIGEELGTELSDLLAQTAGDAYLAEATQQGNLDLAAVQAGLESALTHMREQAELIRAQLG